LPGPWVELYQLGAAESTTILIRASSVPIRDSLFSLGKAALSEVNDTTDREVIWRVLKHFCGLPRETGTSWRAIVELARSFHWWDLPDCHIRLILYSIISIEPWLWRRLPRDFANDCCRQLNGLRAKRPLERGKFRENLKPPLLVPLAVIGRIQDLPRRQQILLWPLYITARFRPDGRGEVASRTLAEYVSLHEGRPIDRREVSRILNGMIPALLFDLKGSTGKGRGVAANSYRVRFAEYPLEGELVTQTDAEMQLELIPWTAILARELNRSYWNREASQVEAQ
jgi:hypothetical protein